MGRHLSRASGLAGMLLYPWPSVGAERRRYAEPHRLGARTGQGRQPRSGRASARALTRSTSSPPPTAGITPRPNNPSGAPMPRDAELWRHNLVFGGVGKTHDHDAALRISGKAPGRQDHSVERRKPGLPAVHRHLGSRRTFTVSLGECRYCLVLLSSLLISRRYAAQ